MTEAREIMMGHKGWFKSFSPPIILPKAELDRLYAHAFPRTSVRTEAGITAPPSGKLLTNSPSRKTPLTTPNNAPNESGYRQKILFPGTTKEWRLPILIGAGAYDDASDEDSCDGDMCLSDYIKQETKESTAALFLGIAKTFEQFQIDNRNKHIVVWLDQVTPAHLLQPMAC
ncbi:hypothetical protein V8E54_004210 [Elaphomyces granulatus]